MKHYTLNNDIKIPALGFGVFLIQDKEICIERVVTAIQKG